MTASLESVRQSLHQLADLLPQNATWEDVCRLVEFRASIERGIAQSESGATISHEEVLREFGCD